MPDSEIGKLIGKRYRTIKKLGSGGFGVTYLAEDENLQQHVVIKACLFDGADAKKSRVRFLKEARTLASLQDIPGIVRVLDFFEEEDTAYIVMEFVPGISLRSFLENREEMMSFREAADCLQPVADVLEAIHKKGILHRDVSPDNILVREDGTLVLVDFGSARNFSYDREKTMTVMVKNGYAPPEQYAVKSRQGPWCDVYAYCAVLYEMITGTVPESALNRLEKDTLLPPSAYGAAISPEEEKDLMHGLALDCRARFKSMDDLPWCRGSWKELPRCRGLWLGLGLALLAAALFSLFFFQPKTHVSYDRTEYAGNYVNHSARYDEFVDYIRTHAQVEQKKAKTDLVPAATLYTLSPSDARAWGKPCNEYHFPLTEEAFLQKMQALGWHLTKTDSSEEATAEVRDYGAILTKFEQTHSYDTGKHVKLKIISDLVSNEIFHIVVCRTGKPKSDDAGQLHALAADSLCSISEDWSKDRQATIEICKDLDEKKSKDIKNDMLYTLDAADCLAMPVTTADRGTAFGLLPTGFFDLSDDYDWPGC